jgi:hypothetical protein
MKLTKDQGKFLVAKFSKLRSCPMCGGADYRFSDRVQALCSYEPDVNKPIEMAPIVAVCCKPCGFLMMFSAHDLGLSPDESVTRTTN